MSFTHLHVHTDYSLLDGLGKIGDYVNKAKELGQTALAITDHGVGYGLVDFYSTCKNKGIKPILGCEVYVAPNSRFIKDAVQRERYYHLILLVKDDIGYKNLCYLISRSNTEGFYFKPRIDFELLKSHHDGLVCLSGCVAGEVSNRILNNDFSGAENVIDRYYNLFGEDYYLEIQNHGLTDEQKAYTEIIKIAKRKDIKLVCTNDCHYVDSKDAKAHEWLLCLQTGKTINDNDRMIYEGDYSLKSEAEMRKLFPAFQEAFDNTEEVVNKCNFDFKFADKPSDYRMPKVVIPEEFGDDYFGYLKHITYEGLETRYPEGHEEREQALEDVKYELSVIENMGFAEYFLDTLKTIKWARNNGILVGPGRGSGAGSRVNYCVGITDIDPIKYNLLFERFLNPERISMPDIDVDYCYTHKDRILESEAISNGKDKFAKIQTFQTMKARGVIRDMVRVGGLPAVVGDKLAKMIPEGISLSEAYNTNPEIKEYLESSEDGDILKSIWNIALKIEGTKKSPSTHACGHIPTPVPCEELFPCNVDKESGYLICQYNMAEAEHLGNLKKDLLMLRNLAVIEFAHREIKKNKNIDIPLWTEEILNDKEALNMIASGDTNGVFQLEGAGMTKFMKELKPDCFEDIIAGVSLYRPGPMDYIPKYVEGKHNPSSITYLTPELEPILKGTYGVIVYQEQVMQVVRDLADFSMGRSDLVRKAMGKKKMDIMKAEGKNFIYGNEELGIKGCIKNGISEEIARKIYEQMTEFAKYAFNKSHAAAYAAISMQTAYLKCHYKTEFMAGLMSSVMDSTTKLAIYTNDCRVENINVNAPDINSSDVEFSIDGDSIRYGLVATKSVGENIAKEIVDERIHNGLYNSFSDVVERNPDLKKNAIESLIKAGAFDFTGNTRRSMLTYLESAIKSIKDRNKGQVDGQISLFDLIPSEVLSSEYKFPKMVEMEQQSLLKMEKESIGVYMSGHPLDDFLTILKERCNITEELLEPVENEYGEKISNANITDGQDVTYGGIIIESKVIYTKKNEPMAFITVEGLYGTIRCIVFPRQYGKYKDILIDDTKILFEGKVSLNDEKGNSILIDTIECLDNIGKTIWLKFDDMGAYSKAVSNISLIIDNNAGTSNIVYYIAGTKQKKLQKQCIDSTKAFEYLKNVVGAENIVIR